MPPIDLATIALREEARLAAGVADIAAQSRPFAGGTAGRDVPGAWTNAVAGAGHAGPVERAELREIIAWYTEAGIEPRFEVSPYVDASLLGHLAEEGFVVRVFENVFFRALSANEPIVSPYPTFDDVVLDVVDPSDAPTVDAFCRVVLAGFLSDGAAEPPEELLAVWRRIVHHPRTTCVAARRGSTVVGGGSVELRGESGSLFGLSVHPEHRRAGVQSALIAWRLRFAAERGAKFVTISARPRVATERNAMRAGFQVAYTKVILVRPGPGLVPVSE